MNAVGEDECPNECPCCGGPMDEQQSDVTSDGEIVCLDCMALYYPEEYDELGGNEE